MIPQEEFRKIPRVLIWGQGLTAGETASRLNSLGYEVKVVNPDDQIRLLNIEGFAGDFRVSLGKQDSCSPFVELGGQRGMLKEVWTENVGAIVFAPELASEGNYFPCRLTPSSQTITLEELTAILFPVSQNTPSSLPPKIGEDEGGGEREKRAVEFINSDSYVAFLVGLSTEGNVLDMEKALSAALKIREKYRSQVSIFCRQVKVAGEGMERLYQACRDEGVLFFKFDQEGPLLLRAGNEIGLQFEDPILKLPFKLTPDLLVVDSRHSLPLEVLEGALSSGIGMDKSGFLQPANVHLLPQASLREGIFIAGPGKGPMLPLACVEEAGATALSVHHFFQGRTSEPMNQEVTVDKGLCTLCLTCLRFCPHQAVGWTHRIFIHPLACRRCGICASECPMDAIQIEGYSDEEVETKLKVIQNRWDQVESSQPRIVIFGCQRSARVAWEEIQSSKTSASSVEPLKVQSDVEFISLPCAGKLDSDHILKAYSMGADGALVLACPEENCQSLHGNTYARERIGEARNYLEEAGINPGRIRFEQLSSNMSWYLKEIIGQFVAELQRDE
jgi:quinone-modifying oxidoreductase, subunit QmoB